MVKVPGLMAKKERELRTMKKWKLKTAIKKTQKMKKKVVIFRLSNTREETQKWLHFLMKKKFRMKT